MRGLQSASRGVPAAIRSCRPLVRCTRAASPSGSGITEVPPTAAEGVVAAGERRAPQAPTAECAAFSAPSASYPGRHTPCCLRSPDRRRRKRTMRLDMPVYRDRGRDRGVQPRGAGAGTARGRQRTRRAAANACDACQPRTGRPPAPEAGGIRSRSRGRHGRGTAAAPVDGAGRGCYDLPSGGTILVYQPQIASWDKQTHMVAFSAVSYRGKAAEKPALGTIKLEADTKVALTERLVSFAEDEDRRGQFPDPAQGADARGCGARSTRRFRTTNA